MHKRPRYILSLLLKKCITGYPNKSVWPAYREHSSTTRSFQIVVGYLHKTSRNRCARTRSSIPTAKATLNWALISAYSTYILPFHEFVSVSQTLRHGHGFELERVNCRLCPRHLRAPSLTAKGTAVSFPSTGAKKTLKAFKKKKKSVLVPVRGKLKRVTVHTASDPCALVGLQWKRVGPERMMVLTLSRCFGLPV